MIERLATKHLDYWHGIGEAHQYRYYRCVGCRQLITHKRIHKGGCGCGLSNEVRPAVLTLSDKARCLFLPWTVAR